MKSQRIVWREGLNDRWIGHAARIGLAGGYNALRNNPALTDLARTQRVSEFVGVLKRRNIDRQKGDRTEAVDCEGNRQTSVFPRYGRPQIKGRQHSAPRYSC